MKKLITLFTLALITNLSFAQVVFQSDLSSWTAGNPTDFFGTKTNVASSNVTEVTTGATYGSSYANIINTSSSSHKRFTTQTVTVVPGTTYTIKMWAKTVANDTTNLRVSFYDLTNASYGSYTAYQDVTGTALTMYIDSVVAPAGCTSLEFTLSFRNTNALGFNLDSVSISGPLAPPPALTQIDLPVTFEDTNVDYTMTDFGGNASMLVVDPTSATNHVMEVTKTAGSQTWAGTTIGTATGFATLLPFSTTDHTMNVRVWSPDSNTVIRLKVEDANDVTHTCETEATTTINGGWEILNFNFSNEATGTAALATGLAGGWVYNKASIFFDFNNAGSGKVYYFDDVKWGGNYAGARELTIENLNVYPNPTSNTWNITNGGNIINQIDIYDLKGKLIETSNPNSNKVKINAINYPSGIYIIKAITNNGVANKRVVKN